MEDIQRTNLIKSLSLEKTKKPDLPGLPELPEDGLVINIDPRQCFNWDDLLGVLFPANIRISKRCAIAQVWMQSVLLARWRYLQSTRRIHNKDLSWNWNCGGYISSWLQFIHI